MKLGIIGYGARISHIVRKIQEINPAYEVAGIVDPRIAKQKQASRPDDLPPCFDTAADMVRAIKPDGILIGTRCSLHTRYALEVLPLGIPLYLEKPVATTLEDWRALKEASIRYATPVVVSHPLRLTSILQQVKEIIDAGTIGTVENVQAVNNIVGARIKLRNSSPNEGG